MDIGSNGKYPGCALSTPRTSIIKFVHKNFHCYYYLSRMPSEHNSPEFNCDFRVAIRFTPEEARAAHETLRGFYCDRSRAADEKQYEANLSFFGDLRIADIGPREIINNEARPFLLWADKHHHDALADMIDEYIHKKQNA